jgi:hypothetical protein
MRAVCTCFSHCLPTLVCILCCSMRHCAITQRHHAACCLRPRRPLPHAATPPRPPPPPQSPFTSCPFTFAPPSSSHCIPPETARRHATRQVHQVQAAACSDLSSCSHPIAAHCVANHLVSSHACFALARYGLYALRARSSATHVSPPPDMPHNVAASVWQCRASSNRLQVQSVTPAFLHSANGGDV